MVYKSNKTDLQNRNLCSIGDVCEIIGNLDESDYEQLEATINSDKAVSVGIQKLPTKQGKTRIISNTYREISRQQG